MTILTSDRFLQDFGYYDEELHAFNMSAGRQTLLYGATLSCTVIACTLSGPIGARYGRRVGLALCAITSIVGPAIQTGATTVPALVVGRAIAGLGIGFAANFVITYWSEVTPVELRGLIVVMYQGFINVSQFIGAAINEGTHGMTVRWAYRAPLLTELLSPLLLLAFLPFIPDTPSKCLTN
jgi:SP family sugar:H+ symporter-like MFS transporter